MAIKQLGNERTTAYVDGQDLVMERVFEAPRELVWKVMNDPELVTRWWGPQGYTTTVEEMDVRPGGRWRWITTRPVARTPRSVASTSRSCRRSASSDLLLRRPGFDDRPAIETMVLEDLGERTKVTARSRFPSIEDLEGALAVGMIHGALDSYDRLAELIGEAAAGA